MVVLGGLKFLMSEVPLERNQSVDYEGVGTPNLGRDVTKYASHKTLT